MQPDPIVEEIHRIREEIAARFNYDIDAIGKDAQQRDAAGDRQIVRRPPRRPVAPAKAIPQPPSAAASDCTSAPAPK
jgi:hypothetical protein